jgi:hypothetical protein
MRNRKQIEQAGCRADLALHLNNLGHGQVSRGEEKKKKSRPLKRKRGVALATPLVYAILAHLSRTLNLTFTFTSLSTQTPR